MSKMQAADNLNASNEDTLVMAYCTVLTHRCHWAVTGST